ERRVRPGLRVLVIVLALVGVRFPKSLPDERAVSVPQKECRPEGVTSRQRGVTSHNSSGKARKPENRRPRGNMMKRCAFIAMHARRTPGRYALKYRGEEISYGTFDARICKVGGWLTARGIGRGDVVAVLMKNSAAFLELVFAVSHIGAVLLPINYRLSADEVGYIVGNSGARLLIADDELASIAAGNVPV